MQRHRWAIDVIWLLTVHLCPVGPRVLDTCSLNIRAIHIREDYGTPLSQSLIHSYFLGPQTSLRFYLRSCTDAIYCFIYDCARSTLYCLGLWPVYAVSTSPVLGSQSLTAGPTNLESVSESASFVAGLLNGVAPWNISESCDCFVVKASLGFDLVFPRLIECVLLFVHPCRVKLSESRVRGYGRLGAQYLDHRQL
jgi:hypothetical protein